MKIIVLTAPVILLSCIISVKGATLTVKGRPNEEINTDTDVEVVCIHPNISALLEALEYMKVDFEVIQGFIDSGSKGNELIFETKKGVNCKGYDVIEIIIGSITPDQPIASYRRKSSLGWGLKSY